LEVLLREALNCSLELVPLGPSNESFSLLFSLPEDPGSLDESILGRNNVMPFCHDGTDQDLTEFLLPPVDFLFDTLPLLELVGVDLVGAGGSFLGALATTAVCLKTCEIHYAFVHDKPRLAAG